MLKSFKKLKQMPIFNLLINSGYSRTQATKLLSDEMDHDLKSRYEDKAWDLLIEDGITKVVDLFNWDDSIMGLDFWCDMHDQSYDWKPLPLPLPRLKISKGPIKVGDRIQLLDGTIVDAKPEALCCDGCILNDGVIFNCSKFIKQCNKNELGMLGCGDAADKSDRFILVKVVD